MTKQTTSPVSFKRKRHRHRKVLSYTFAPRQGDMGSWGND
jgi:hypothetical protein